MYCKWFLWLIYLNWSCTCGKDCMQWTSDKLTELGIFHPWRYSWGTACRWCCGSFLVDTSPCFIYFFCDGCTPVFLHITSSSLNSSKECGCSVCSVFSELFYKVPPLVILFKPRWILKWVTCSPGTLLAQVKSLVGGIVIWIITIMVVPCHWIPSGT